VRRVRNADLSAGISTAVERWRRTRGFGIARLGAKDPPFPIADSGLHRYRELGQFTVAEEVYVVHFSTRTAPKSVMGT
jgi:hypothetical protein